MVGSSFLQSMSKQLCEILKFDVMPPTFGGVSILAVGNLYE